MQTTNILSADESVATRRRQYVLVLQGSATVFVALALVLDEPWSHLAAIVSLVANAGMLGILLLYGRVAVREMYQQVRLVTTAEGSRRQVEELFAMTDMLQAAEDHDDAGAILMATTQRLLPELSGALYVFNNSQDRLDLAKKWNVGETFHPAPSLLPGNCWALKRGKPHINDPASSTLCCLHLIGTAATVEVPMMARGQVFGLLVLAIDCEGAYQRLREITRTARALADSMSLALSNIALREKLRTQSLRDPLTGLYNRRYMEDALERYVSLGERSGSATSVLMIDLDNFKRLNDEHGHAKGDAVLRDVAAQLVASLRPSDVVARYGGEELIVILPDCELSDAELKAEMLRLRIESLGEIHGVPISASFGVATIPETAGGAADIIPMADAALYNAKTAGKNRVASAERRAVRDDAPRLAVSGRA